MLGGVHLTVGDNPGVGKAIYPRSSMVFSHPVAGGTYFISHGTHKSKITIDVNHPKSVHLGIPAKYLLPSS